ncbi:NADPH-dependent F420 reductase [Streptomyces sp. NPDC055144]
MATQSTIGILGAGQIGRAVADKAVRHGHEVLIGNSRGPETLKAVVEQLGPKAHAVTAEEAAQPDLVFLAVPFSAVPDLTSLTDWSGKIVVRRISSPRPTPGGAGTTSVTSRAANGSPSAYPERGS